MEKYKIIKKAINFKEFKEFSSKISYDSRISDFEIYWDEIDWDMVIEHEEKLKINPNKVINSTRQIIDAVNKGSVFAEMASNLSGYNTMRGGAEGFKGFVFEEMHAANASVNGDLTKVIANNGNADFLIIDKSGKEIYGQAKVGYKNTKVDWSKYGDQKVVIDKGNSELIAKAREAGMDVVESNISSAEAKKLAKQMQFESKICKKTTAPITAHIKSMNSAGIECAKSGAAFGAGMSIGSNLVDVVNGEKEIGEATKEIVKDTLVAGTTSYVTGAVVSGVLSTSAGAAAATAVTGTVATIGSAVATSAIGSATIAGATAAGTAVATSAVGTAAVATGAAITGAATTAGAAIASTAVGSAVVAAGTAVAGTAVGAAVIAAAPIVVAGAVVGGGVKIIKKLFWD